jgi:hypothetical protein
MSYYTHHLQQLQQQPLDFPRADDHGFGRWGRKRERTANFQKTVQTHHSSSISRFNLRAISTGQFGKCGILGAVNTESILLQNGHLV